jgi:hypothetical protein
MVMKVLDRDTLLTFSAVELQTVAEDCLKGLQTMPRLNEDDVEPILGNFQAVQI